MLYLPILVKISDFDSAVFSTSPRGEAWSSAVLLEIEVEIWYLPIGTIDPIYATLALFEFS